MAKVNNKNIKFEYRYRLEDLKEERDLKNKDIAKALNVTDSVYSQFETLKLSIPTKRLVELANFYEVNIDYMLRLTDKRVHIKTSNDIDIKLVGYRAKKARKETKLTMEKLANLMNASISTISEYENGKRLIPGHLIIELAKATNHSIDWILGRSDIKEIQK